MSFVSSNRYMTRGLGSGSGEANPFRNPPTANSHTHFVPTRSTGPPESHSVSSTVQQPVIKPPKPPEKPLVPYMRFSRQVRRQVPHTHTHFVPTRSTGPPESHSVSSTVQQPVIKPLKPPEKPLVPYMRFSRQVWHKVREENKDCAVHDVGRKIGTLWRELSDREKGIFQEQWEAEKIEYDKQMKAYHNSAAYQAYLQAKSGQMPPPKGKDSKSSNRVESGVFIQPVDEDDGGEYQMSVRRVAAMRYERNQRLMGELLSEAWVGDARNVVTQQRMAMLKRQASSLATHQKNLETELVALEDKFGKKKREMSESSAAFAAKLAEVNAQRPSLDPELYDEMVEKSCEKMLSAYKESLETKASSEPPASTTPEAASPVVTT